ncbi:BON domain-containing protein [Undibacterium cyanobacteriorum]|uniref:BON domain-containing protein n=1 Tax=Undibacterium cyanobacteriorum TaxID=3073561 RepID=A0ABY9RLF9_9BURK|nr:BON domain-containing protein [Undibacterium sp. 20NA77.5]WMW81100.1 BON domain-containing protein [Undibacterium sp. 20NA77.5]
MNKSVTKWFSVYSWAKPISVIALSSAALLSLQGCVAMVVGGAVVGTMAAIDRRTLGAQTEDKAIVLKGESAIKRALLSDQAHVNVTSYNRRALLTGEVPDAESKATAERELKAVQGVTLVMNELVIGSPSSISARSNDALITTKIKASFVDTKDINESAFKVVTEAGNVYLMGRVTQREGATAASVAAGVSGVKKVTKMFEYITEDELKALQASKSKVDLNQEEK